MTQAPDVRADSAARQPRQADDLGPLVELVPLDGGLEPGAPPDAHSALAAADIAAVVDGGPCPVGVESTIVDMTAAPRLLRPGGLPVEAVEAALGGPLQPPPANSDTRPTSPGQLVSHYAPRARLRLNAASARPGEALLGFGPVAGAAETLSMNGDLAEATANLFAALHRLDATGTPAIAVSPIPDHGLGRAINDRLRRAAAPRD